MITVTFETVQDREGAHMLLQDFNVPHTMLEFKKKAFKKTYPQLTVDTEEDLARLQSLLTSRGVEYHAEST